MKINRTGLLFDQMYFVSEKSNICLGQILKSIDTARDRKLYGDQGEIKKFDLFLEDMANFQLLQSFSFTSKFQTELQVQLQIHCII